MPPENNNANPISTSVPPIPSSPLPQTPLSTPVEPISPPTPPTPPIESSPMPEMPSKPIKSDQKSSSGSFMSLLLIPILLLLGIGTALALVYFFPDVFESFGIIKKQEANNTQDTDNNTDEEEETEVTQKTETISCPEWIYAVEGHEDGYYMTIVYKDLPGVTFTNLNDSCGNIEMGYKGATLFLTYSYGEAFAQSIPEGQEMKTVVTKDIGENSVTLVRPQEGVVLEGSSYGELDPGVVYKYSQLLSTANECTSEINPDVTVPCILGGNPFVEVTGDFTVYIPDTATDAEETEILEFFDYVATNSSSFNYNTDQAAE